MTELSEFAQDLRGVLTQAIASLGYAPSTAELARLSASDEASVVAAFAELAHAHAVLLHPNSSQPWVVHPFALTAGPCWVQTYTEGLNHAHGYWANCLYCAFGIAACTRRDCTITTRYGGEAETLQLQIAQGDLVNQAGVVNQAGMFHLSTPVAQWWDNVVAACFSFQVFKNERQIDDWCSRHNMARGAVMGLPQLWRFASEWYGDYLVTPWRKRSPEQVKALFERHALRGPFWSLNSIQ